jgi:hypothetical protein
VIVSTEYPPPPTVVAAINAPTTRIDARVEIYEQDGVTRWAYDNVRRLIEGSISVDYSRDERRTLDLTLDNSDNVLLNAPGYFWYDKVIKVFKRVRVHTSTFDAWECQVGEFMIDSIDEDHFPMHTHIQGRDYTKKCLNSQFVVTTEFDGGAGYTLEGLISALAANAGATKQVLPTTGINVTQTFTGEPGQSRWEVMKQIANAYNYDVYFDPQGYLRLIPFPDPATQSPAFTFQTGLPNGNLVGYSKSTDDARLYNHVLVIGTTDNTNVPTWAEAKNTNASSPTSIAEIGDRLYQFNSDYIHIRTNLANNPSFESNTTDRTITAGTGGASTAAQFADARPGSTGTKCLRQTWTTATTAVSGGIGMGTGPVSLASQSVVEGAVYSTGVWVRTNKIQRIKLQMDFRDPKEAVAGQIDSPHTVLAANTWTFLKFEGQTAPAGADHLYVWAYAAVGTSGTNWAINDWLEIDDIIIEAAAKIGDYFDGSYYACGWEGATNNSQSLSNRQAQDVADTFLSVHQLEQFSLDLTSLNVFYIDVGTVVEFDDPRPAPGDPDRFLLQSMTVPIGLGTMSATAARVENVGGT